MKKIVMVVDNPKRDLGGLSYLSYELAKRNIEVYLVPMYEQELHIYSINPDMVLLNYCRPANAKKILNYVKKGFKVAILDTEGGIRRNDEEFFKGIELSNVGNCIDLYLTWGNVQKRIVSDYFRQNNYKSNVICTGVPRYDFLDSSFEKFMPFTVENDKYILLIASFPLCNPKFTSLDEEASNMVEALGYSLNKIKKMQNRFLKRMDNYIDLIKKILLKYPNHKFVFRAHPFEDQNVYKNIFKDFRNVIINESGEIFNLIHNAKLTVQINSSTGTEAAMASIPVLQPEYLNDEEDSVSQITNISYLAYSEEDFINLFELLLNNNFDNKIVNRKKEIELYTNKLIHDYFFKIDGKSSERVSKAIDEYLTSIDDKSNDLKLDFSIEYIILFMKNISKLLIKKSFMQNRKFKNLEKNVINNIISFKENDMIETIKESYYFGKLKSSRIKINKKKRT